MMCKYLKTALKNMSLVTVLHCYSHGKLGMLVYDS